MKLADLTRLDASKLTDESAVELSMALIAAARQRSGRSCGSCSQCCKTLSINAPELTKPMDRWCEFCKPGKGGCTVYSERPNKTDVVDASTPHRWREQPYLSGIKQAAIAGLSQRGAGHFITHVEVAERKFLILPAREIEVGGQAHTIVQTGAQQWDVLVFETPERAQEIITKANVAIDVIATYPAEQQDAMLFQLNRLLVSKFGARP
jgi:hypothetical protein